MIEKKTNISAMTVLILGLSTIALPLYLTIVIAFKQPTEMTNSISGILSLLNFPTNIIGENIRFIK